jgi:hypothetical protein
MPAFAIIIPIAVDLAVTTVAADLIATIAVSTLVIDVAAGVIGGIAGGIVSAELTGGDVGKAALLGGLGGGLSGGLAAAGGGLTGGIVKTVANATNLPTGVVNTVLQAAEGAGVGAGRALATGGNVGKGALAGGISGLGSGLGGQFNYTDIANQTGIPPDVVQGVLNAAGKAGFGAGAAAATGQDVGLSALSGAAQGALPPLIKEAFDGAKAAYNAAFGPAQDAATQAAQDAYAAIVTPAQNQLNALEQQGQDYLDSYKAGLISQIQDAQTKYEQALAAVNQEPWAIRIVNGEAPPPTGPRGSGNLGAYEAAKPIADAYQQADQNLQAVTQQATADWNSIQQMVQSQFDSNSQPLIQTIQNAGSDPSVQQAYDTTLQQNLAPAQQQLADAQSAVDAALQQVNPVGTAEAAPAALENPFAGNYQGYQSLAQASQALPQTTAAERNQYFVAQGSDGLFYVVPKADAAVGTPLGDFIQKNYAVSNPAPPSSTAGEPHVGVQFSPPLVYPAGGPDPGAGGPTGAGGTGGALSGQDATTPGAAGDPGTTSFNTPQAQNLVPGAGSQELSSRDRQLISLSGLSSQPAQQQGVSTTNLDFGTFSAPVPSTHDQQIRNLAGLSTAPTTSQTAASSASGTGTTAGTGSGTGTSEGFGGTGTGAGGAGTGTGAGGQEGGTGGGGTGGTGSGDGKTLDFGAGTIPLAQRRPAGQTSGPTTPDIPGPGSQALAQALAAPAIGYSPGGDIFGVLGKRTPVWNQSSLRAEDTSGVSG